MKAMILAAGFGERLRPLTDRAAKPSLMVDGVPILSRVLAFLAREGAASAVVNLHHVPGSIREALEKNPPPIPVGFSEERKILGTGGGLAHARRFFGGEEMFLLVNGDCLYDFPLAGALARFRAGAAAAMLVCVARREGFTPVWEEAGRLVSIGGETPSAKARALTFAGIHLVRPAAFAHFPDRDAFDIVRDVYVPMLGKGERIEVFEANGLWEDCGTPERLREAERRLAERASARLPQK